MRIGFDISMLVYQGSGVATHTFNLVKHLLAEDKKNEYKLFYSSLRRPDNFYYLEELKKLGAKVYDYYFPPRLLKLWWNRFEIMPVEWFIGKVDVLHSSDFLRPPLLMGTKGLTTIHDLTWKIYPEYHTNDVIRAHELKIQRTIKNRDTIIVDSENTKLDLLKYFPEARANKIFTIYLGVDEKFRKINDKKLINKRLKKYKIPIDKPYLLYVGAIEPRKNLGTSINVFGKLIKEKKYSGMTFVIAGRAGWKNERIFSLVVELGLKDKVKFVGFVEDEDLLYIYNGAEALIYLSKYEGFGLPPLEALACGTKVIAGDNSSVKEVVEKKYLCGTDDEDEILRKLKNVLEMPKLKTSVRKFTWDKTAREFLRVIEKI
jgi:glycosyltransferase involved in cell wall biosynthesis